MVCTSIYVKSVLRYKFVIFDAHYRDTLYLRERGCDDPWLLFEAKKRPRAKVFGKYCSIYRFSALTSTV
jgi:hypothetical protein